MRDAAERDEQIGWEDIFRPVVDLVRRKVAGETIIVPIRGNLADMQRIFSLNAVAESVWEELDGNKSLADARRSVVEKFDVSEEEAGEDLLRFIGDALAAGIVERVER